MLYGNTMTSPVNEFGMNLPMMSVPPMGDTTSAVAAVSAPVEVDVAPYDATADVEVPEDVSPAFSHINVFVDSSSSVDYSSDNPAVLVDMVLTVSVTNPETGAMTNSKVVKRVSFDKVKLALEAEKTQAQVVEAEVEDPEVVRLEMQAFYAKKRMREIAGLRESAGTKKFKVLFSFDSKDAGSRDSASVEYDAITDKAHARHVFDSKVDKTKYKNIKITRITEVQ